MPKPDDDKVLGYQAAHVESAARRSVTIELFDTAYPTLQRFPNICCSCLVPTEGRWMMPTNTNVRLRVPICPDCLRRWKRRMRAIVLLAFATVPFTAFSFSMVSPSRHTLINLAGFCLPGIMVATAAANIGCYFAGTPIRAKLRGRGDRKLTLYFANPDFVPLLDGYL